MIDARSGGAVQRREVRTGAAGIWSCPGVPVEHELVRALIPAIATLRTADDVLEERLMAELALRLAHEACSRAAIECRRYGLDDALLRCAAACDQAVTEIQLLLTALVHE